MSHKSDFPLAETSGTIEGGPILWNQGWCPSRRNVRAINGPVSVGGRHFLGRRAEPVRFLPCGKPGMEPGCRRWSWQRPDANHFLRTSRTTMSSTMISLTIVLAESDREIEMIVDARTATRASALKRSGLLATHDGLLCVAESAFILLDEPKFRLLLKRPAARVYAVPRIAVDELHAASL